MKNKKIKFLTLGLLATTFVLAGCEPETSSPLPSSTTSSTTTTTSTPTTPAVIEVASVSLDKTSVTLDVGGCETLAATILPEDATDKSLTWTSDHPEIATVENGVVTAVKPGDAVITVSSTNGKTATCAVHVNPILATSIELNATEVSLLTDQTFQLTATVLPEDTTDKSLTWTSENEQVATVKDGLITAVGKGETTIVVRSTANPSVQKEVSVLVRDVATEMAELTIDVTLDKYLSINADLLLFYEGASSFEDAIVMTEVDAERTHFKATFEDIDVAGGTDANGFEYKLVVVSAMDHEGLGYAYSYPNDGTAETIGTYAISTLTDAEKETGKKTVSVEDLEIARPPFVDDNDRSYFITRIYSVDDNNANITDRYIGGLEIMDEEGNILDSSEDYATVAIGENYKVRMTFQQQAEGILLIPNATEGLFNENTVEFVQTDEEGYVFEATFEKSSKDTNFKIYVEQQYGVKLDDALIPLVQSVRINGEDVDSSTWGEIHYYPYASTIEVQFTPEEGTNKDYQAVGQKINAPDSYAFESSLLPGIASVLSFSTELTRNDVKILLLEEEAEFVPETGTQVNLIGADFPYGYTIQDDGRNYNDGHHVERLNNGLLIGDNGSTEKAWSTWRQPGAGGQDGAACYIDFYWDCYFTINEFHVWYYGHEGQIPKDFRIEYSTPDGKFGEEDGNILRKSEGDITIDEEKNQASFENKYVLNGEEGIVTNHLRFYCQAEVDNWVALTEISILSNF